jgi:hypothetical protein
VYFHEKCVVHLTFFPFKYFPLAKPNTIYHGYNINAINTCARFVCYSTEGGETEARQLLSSAQTWFNSKTEYDVLPLDAPVVLNTGNSLKHSMPSVLNGGSSGGLKQEPQQLSTPSSITTVSAVHPTLNQLISSPAIKRKDSKRLIMEDKGLQKKMELNQELRSQTIEISTLNGAAPQQQQNSSS